MSKAKKGMVLLVHGSRDPGWLTPFEDLRAEVEAASEGVRVGLACLQFSPPALAEAIAAIAGEGISEIGIVPVFISVRGHVLKDVPGVVAEARQKFPGLRLTVTEAGGEQAEVKAALRAGLVRLALEG